MKRKYVAIGRNNKNESAQGKNRYEQGSCCISFLRLQRNKATLCVVYFPPCKAPIMSSVFQAQGFFFKVYKTQIKHKKLNIGRKGTAEKLWY